VLSRGNSLLRANLGGVPATRQHRPVAGRVSLPRNRRHHAEESVNLFDQIEAFDPHGIDRPEQLRNLLINDVRDAHPKLYEDLSVLLIRAADTAKGSRDRRARSVDFCWWR